MVKLVQQSITNYIGKNKNIKKEERKNNINQISESQYENDSTGSQFDDKIERNNLKIVS